MRCVSRSYWWLSKFLMLLASLSVTPQTHGISADVYANPTRWSDENGETVTLQKLRGKKSVFALFYASCKTICPMTVKSLKEVSKGLGTAAKDVQFVLVTIDPADNKNRIADFMAQQKIPVGWKVLSSDTVNTRNLAGALGVGFEDKPVNGNLHNMHSLSLVVVNADGSVAGQVPVSNPDVKLMRKILNH